jgi:hypothetical protein
MFNGLRIFSGEEHRSRNGSLNHEKGEHAYLHQIRLEFWAEASEVLFIVCTPTWPGGTQGIRFHTRLIFIRTGSAFCIVRYNFCTVSRSKFHWLERSRDPRSRGKHDESTNHHKPHLEHHNTYKTPEGETHDTRAPGCLAPTANKNASHWSYLPWTDPPNLLIPHRNDMLERGGHVPLRPLE